MQFCTQTGREALKSVRFLGIDIEVSGAVLRPREETELLGGAARKLLDEMGTEPRCIDVCCGSGNLAIALATHAPTARVWASDSSPDAVTTTRRNVSRLDLDQRIAVLEGDVFAPMEGASLANSIDLVVANPPYISTSRLLEGDRAHLLAQEPREAFDGGPYGISIHMRLINEAPPFLKSGGWLGLEFGAGQDRQIGALLKRSRMFAEPVWHSDAQGEKRVVFARKL